MLLEIIKDAIGCEYLSDLRKNPYNTIAKKILSIILNPKTYSTQEIQDAIKYLENHKI